VSRARQFAQMFAPWTGLVVGLIALILVHQYGSDGTFDDCRAVSPRPLLVVGFVGLLLCGGSGIISRRSAKSSANEVRRLVATISIGAAALFAFAIALAMVASLLLPPCFQ
jgi:hypothetical protein